jgi:hypothetical protein
MTRKAPALKFRSAAVFTAAISGLLSTAAQSVEERLRALEMQNETLRQQLAEQRETISQLQSRLENPGHPADDKSISKSGGFHFGPVHLSGEGGVGYFHTGSDGQFRSGTFRVDEAKLFLEAPLWEGTYFFGELDLVLREANDEYFHLGELYIDFENVLRHWTDKNYLSLRAGRMDIPFGEEYLVRDVMDNPLISHSLADLWGVDEGLEAYGSAFGFDYVVAVQNGGHPTLEDFDGDKSVAGRIGYNLGNRARLSFSGMRTGKLSTGKDRMSELWFGNGFFRSLGPAETTPTYEADVFELDAQAFWNTGHLKLAGGYFQYDDTNPTIDHSRDGWYYSAEALQNLTGKFYSAARFSQIIADDGMPVVGHGGFGKYFFGPLTKDLWRFSIGMGYRWNENLVAKLEYTIERGELLHGAKRNDHDFVGAELGFKF